MSFIHHDFLWFLPLACGGWWWLRRRYPVRIGFLLGASLLFYGWSRPDVVVVLLAYALVDWKVGIWLARTTRRRTALTVGLIFNLGVLCCWKYTPLILTTVGSLVDRPQIGASFIDSPAWVVPMGLSFYSFTGIAYMVDVYRGVAAPEMNGWRFALFTSFFPHLVAGPILRAGEFLTDLQPAALPSRPEAPMEALVLIARGYFKKLVLADNIGFAIDPFFAEIGHPATAGVWSFPYLVLYSWQIYFDFSGYTDIARGLGLAFGFRWPENFHSPYLAVSVRDFWRRWHMTLSRFMRDYVYISMGGSRGGVSWTVFTIMTTMTLCGFWHGASWTFLVWGALHGVALLMNRAWQGAQLVQRTPLLHSIPPVLRKSAATALTFTVVTLLWSFFRLIRLGDSLECLHKVVRFDWSRAFGGGAADTSIWLLLGIYALVAAASARAISPHPGQPWFLRMPQPSFVRGLIAGSAVGLLCLSILVARTGERTPFIYFQF